MQLFNHNKIYLTYVFTLVIFGEVRVGGTYKKSRFYVLR